MATTTATPKIVGKALDLELVADPTLTEDERRSLLGWQNGTKQVIVFPQYQDDTGTIHEPIIMNRIVSSYSPRSQWETHNLDRCVKPMTEEEIRASDSETSYYKSYANFQYYTSAEWAVLTEREKYESRKFTLNMALRNHTIDTTYAGEGDERRIVAKQGWLVREGKPISVEITDQDMSDILGHKTPQAVIRRINKVRGTLDKFPEKLG